MKATLLASSHYLHAVGSDHLPPLDEALREACREHHRRVDRFIQLSLLGAARCAAGRSLGPDCFLYLGSGVGPEGNNIVVQEQICRDHLLPRPFNFVNTLGSAATYYVAKELGLEGQGWWVARRGASLEALLELALADMELGLCASALVGVVEECPQPYEDHRRRIHAPENAAMAEGSHWLLLDAAPEAGTGGIAADFHLDGVSLIESIRAAWRPGDSLAFGPGIPGPFASTLASAAGAPLEPNGLPIHDSLAAAGLTAWLQTKPKGRLHLLCGIPDSYARLEITASSAAL
jgi:hypothetical protein